LVSAVDVDLSLSNYQDLLENVEGVDHYFILDKNSQKVIMHSWTPFILREDVSIT
jgi:sulfur carrier protein ThiS